jgi:riboflavin kinase / FMN adenylyltransferase
MISGIVIHGKHLGRTIEFPTANISLPCNCTELEDGTYGLSAIVEWRDLFGIWVYLRSAELFEAHFFDFSDDIYGEVISVEPLFKIRDNMKFSWIIELKSQIEKDREVMEEWIEEIGKLS